jgi:hypothetical protein
MLRSLVLAVALSVTAPGLILCSAARAADRTLPMHFDLRLQGPAQACGKTCKTFISAVGAVTADTASDFTHFAQAHDLTGAIMVLDSDGGSVHGAIALGREIRRLALTTTVGRVLDIDTSPDHEATRAALSPTADCESMCAFVLLAGVRRIVPSEARVMVHQIWLGDRRDDPTAASYSAEDLVLVQRDIGKLAQYTSDMGASIELLDLALRIPPWEPMHSMTRDELQRTRLTTEDTMPAATVAANQATAPIHVSAPITEAVRTAPISERRWSMVDQAGVTMLARRHPLTMEGEDIGSFDLLVACAASTGTFDVSYMERRHGGERAPLPDKIKTVTLRLGAKQVALKVASSERQSDELLTAAAGPISTSLIDSFAAIGNHSIAVETEGGVKATTIRLGNTGAAQSLPQLVAACSKSSSARAELTPKTGGLAAAQ